MCDMCVDIVDVIEMYPKFLNERTVELIALKPSCIVYTIINLTFLREKSINKT